MDPAHPKPRRSFSPAGAPLPGWGHVLREQVLPAIVIAAFAGFAPAGSQAAMPGSLASAPTEDCGARDGSIATVG